MADDEKPQDTPSGEGEQKPAAPQFDYDALASQVAGKLKDEFRQAAPAPQPQPQPQLQRPVDPVEELVSPYTKKAEARAALAELAATDAVMFYANHGDIEKEDRTEVERRFNAMKDKGVPFTREDIYAHMLGERIDKEVDKRIERRAKKVKEAEQAAASVGAGSPDKIGATSIRDPHAMSTAELEKAMQGMTF
jgi:hypothetical protein